MEKKSKISKRNGAKRDGVCAKVAEVTGASYEYVRLVRMGKRNNKMIEEMINEYAVGESALLQRLEEIKGVYTNYKEGNLPFINRKKVKIQKVN